MSILGVYSREEVMVVSLTGTREIERTGGWLKRCVATGEENVMKGEDEQKSRGLVSWG